MASRFQFRFLRSRVGQRVLGLFLLVALLPMLALAVVAAGHTYRVILDLARSQLQSTSKTYATGVADALGAANGRLDTVAQALAQGVRELPAGLTGEGLHSVTLQLRSGERVDLGHDDGANGARAPAGSGQARALPPPAPQMPAGEHTVLRVEHPPAGPPVVRLMMAVDLPAHGRAVLTGEVDPAFLLARVPPPSGAASACVLDAEALPVACHGNVERLSARALPARVAGATAGLLDGGEGEGRMIGAWRQISLHDSFDAEPWVVVVTQTRASALIPLEFFGTVFPPLVALTVALVIVFSLFHVPRTLEPLEKLTSAFRRLARGQFDVSVHVRNRDEFGDLGRSFNAMAGRLGEQFRMLELLAEIDHLAFTERDVTPVVAKAMEGVFGFVECEAVAVLIFGADKDDSARAHVLQRQPRGDARVRDVPLPAQERRSLSVEALGSLRSGAVAWESLAPLAALGARYFHALPLRGGADAIEPPPRSPSSAAPRGGSCLPWGGPAGADEEPPRSPSFAAPRGGSCLPWGGPAGGMNQEGGERGKRAPLDGCLVLGYRHRPEPAEDKRNYLISLTKRLAVTLSASGWRNQIYQHANFDELTQLPNRQLLTDRLVQEMRRAHRHGKHVAVLFIDLDHFKQINDTLGHEAGDDMLREAARRMAQCVRAEDTVARLGGDEFAVVLGGLHNPQDAALVAQKLLSALREPFHMGGQQLFGAASIGISVYPEDGESAEDLLKRADTATYKAKENGRDGFLFYEGRMNAEQWERLTLGGDLRKALDQGQLLLLYQPQVRLSDGVVVGAEALMRWQHPSRGIVSPAVFIPLAEESGLIEPMGLWALRTACRQFLEWRASGLPLRHIAVNLSARQLRSAHLVQDVTAILAECRMPPGSLELEITESLAMENMEHALQTLVALRDMGVRLAIDDFGTRYSSLAYLRTLPIHVIKLDRAFMQDVLTDRAASTIARSVIDMAHQLDKEIIAEGVERSEQVAFLRVAACDMIQGFYFSKPLAAKDFLAYAQSRLPAGKRRPGRVAAAA
ncbi:MAG: EAL domain-containing protein [Betaproteobacteria bacterium]|nr:EAL domain-containing protein [Betaproteobacteria bacterium]